MGTCVNCKHAGRPTYKSPCSECHGYSKHEAVEIRTNGAKIRAMSDEELAKCIGRNSLCDWIQDNDPGWCDAQPVCSGCIVEWLKQPVEEVKE
jgi:hypothetical protein